MGKYQAWPSRAAPGVLAGENWSELAAFTCILRTGIFQMACKWRSPRSLESGSGFRGEEGKSFPGEACGLEGQGSVNRRLLGPLDQWFSTLMLQPFNAVPMLW